MARLTQELWRALIKEQAASGQTSMAFCAERGIDNKYFSAGKKQWATKPAENRFVAIVREPDAGNLHVRFDERGLEA